MGLVSRPGLPHVYLLCRCLLLSRQAVIEFKLLRFPWPRQLVRTCRALYQSREAIVILKRHLAVRLSILPHGGMYKSDEE